MSWIKLDDAITDHPKFLEAGPLASWLYVCGLAYASRFMTDGFIPQRALARLGTTKHPEAEARALVAAGLWELAPEGYQIHDYLVYQPSAASIKEQRATDSGRKAFGIHADSGRNPAGSRADSGRNPPGSRADSGGIPAAPSRTRPGPVPEGSTLCATPDLESPGGRVAASDALPRATPKSPPRKPPARTGATIDDACIAQLVGEFTPALGEHRARESIARALNHKALTQAVDKRLRLRHWLEDDVKRLKDKEHPNGTTGESREPADHGRPERYPGEFAGIQRALDQYGGS